MRIDAASGAIIERGIAVQPVPAVGEDVLRDTRNPAAIWSPPARAWFFDQWLIAAGRLDGDLAALRAARWAMVKDARDRAEWWGCATPLGRVDTDPESQRKVSGSVQLALIAAAAGEPFSITWTMQDNSGAAHDASAMIAMGVAVGRHVAACHAVALAKREAIDAAGDVAAIGAVDVESGWPDAPEASA